MKKLFIKNRKGQKISVLVEETKGSKELVFIMQGLAGFKEKKNIATFAKTFLELGFTVVRFDTTNNLGESEGKYEDATPTGYFEDLEDIIKWSSTETFYKEPFWLCGYSIGGLCVGLYAEKYPSKVKALAPLASTISGKLSLEVARKLKPLELKQWDETGWKVEVSNSKPGVILKLNWAQYKEDRNKYDLLKNVEKISMPVLMIVGSEDTTTPHYTQEMLFNKLQGDKELHVVKGLGHLLKEESHLKEVSQILEKWIIRVMKK